MTEALGVADGTRKGELLSNLGVLVSYDPLTRRARVTCRPKVSESVVSEGGRDIVPHAPPLLPFAGVPGQRRRVAGHSLRHSCAAASHTHHQDKRQKREQSLTRERFTFTETRKLLCGAVAASVAREELRARAL
jgi:hypothetical protein